MEKKHTHPQNDKIDLPEVKHIVLVGSGKGGVGKSTVAANLATTLASNGFSVALVDADLFGPSIPTMFNVHDGSPEMRKVNGKDMIVPIRKYNVYLQSIGFIADPAKALIWRGPMASNVITQLLTETLWEGIDYMVIDMPPGTSDIQITLAQKLNASGAIFVTTPQSVAVSDVRKAINMFKQPGVDVPLLGIVENMAWFTPEIHPDEKYFLFGKGGGEDLSVEFNIPLLAQIPLVQNVCESGDRGVPVVHDNSSPVAKAFAQLAENIQNIV